MMEASHCSPNALIVFARAPEMTQVKTRLAADLGSQAALMIYRELTEQVIAAVQKTAEYSITVAFTPGHAEPAMREWLGASVTLQQQAGSDLGERLTAAVDAAFAAGAKRVAVIGTDCPDVNAKVVKEAFTHLSMIDLVLGPAYDGGYYLIAMAEPHRALFSDIPWGSGRTLAATLERAHALGLSVVLLDERRDIDTAADWQSWRRASQEVARDSHAAEAVGPRSRATEAPPG